MRRISVTDVDSWLYFMGTAGTEWEQSTEEFLKGLRRETPPNDNMRIGSAFHEIIENMALGRPVECIAEDVYAHEGIAFGFQDVNLQIERPDLTEQKFEKVYDLGPLLGKVTLVGKVDGLRGDRIIEYKTTARLDIDKYRDLFQWQAYLDILPGMQSCTWHILKRYAPKIREIKEPWKADPRYVDHLFWIREALENQDYRLLLNQSDLGHSIVPQVAGALCLKELYAARRSTLLFFIEARMREIKYRQFIYNKIKEAHKLTLYRHPGLKDYVQSTLYEFVACLDGMETAGMKTGKERQ